MPVARTLALVAASLFSMTFLPWTTGCSSSSSGTLPGDSGPARSDAGALDAAAAQGDSHTGPEPDATLDAKSDARADATLPDDAALDGAFDAGFDAFQGDAGLCASNASCPPGTTCCGTCVDTTGNDPNNCGGCGYECDNAAVCDQGSCVFPSCSGPDAHDGPCLLSPGKHGTCCGGACQAIDTSADPANCGGCGVVCPLGATCGSSPPTCLVADGGTAFCQASTDCPAGDVCLFEECFPATCGPGSDENPCARPGPDAGTGSCCNEVCSDPNQDDKNCGQCGVVCGAGSFCAEGTCTTVPSCAASPTGTACPVSPGVVGECCRGTCVDTSSDSQNCTECGQICPNGEACRGGACLLPDGGASGCVDATGCPAGDLCYGSICLRASCTAGEDGIGCAFGLSNDGPGTCCGGVCVNTSEDPGNCGHCGAACPSGVCGSSFGLGQCVPAADAGTCPLPCPNGEACLAGQCVPAACNGPEGFCVAEDGNVGSCCFAAFGFMCSDVSTDTQNCGGCGLRCPAGQTCSGGVCSGTQAPCGAGKVDAYCDLDAGTSSICCPGTGCVNLLSDTKNCGYCGSACPLGLACVSGQCVATTCAGAMDGAYCEVDGGFHASSVCCKGACVDTSSSTANCGGCGTGCAGSETCSEGACGLAACTAATTGDPCHLDGGTGQCCAQGCIDTSSDPANCGGCGLACPPGHACVASSCQ